MKKIALGATKVFKKNNTKSKKPGKDFIAWAKWLYWEAVGFWKKKSKELIEAKKRKEKLELEFKKWEEDK